MEPGYPTFFLYAIILIGLPLALLRPYKVFLMVVFLISAADTVAFTYTRTDLLGAYFNAHDACLLIALVAMFSYVVLIGKNITLPNVIKLMMAVLLIALIQSLLLLEGYHYEVLRSMRWAIALPIYFVIAATLVNTEKKATQLLRVLFLGAVISAIQHILFVQSRASVGSTDIEHLRTIAFRSPGLWLLLSTLVWMPKVKGLNRNILIGGGILFTVSVLLNQTRSIWISSVIAVPLVFKLFPQAGILKKAVTRSFIVLVLFIGVLLMMNYVTPELRPDDIVMKRLGTFVDEDKRFSATITRQLDLRRELEEWLGGTLIFGRGLFYYAPIYFDRVGGYRVAWGHLGHVTTLAQLGLIGFFIYSLYFPWKVIQASKVLWAQQSQEIKFLGLFAGMCLISSWICFLMSDSFLFQHATEGVIFGAVWRQAMLLRGAAVQPERNGPGIGVRTFSPSYHGVPSYRKK